MVTKIFAHHRYSLTGRHTLKRDADKQAERYRSQGGHTARVTKATDGAYLVLTRRKKG